MFDPALKKQGQQGESDLAAWFDRHGFSHLAIDQKDRTFAKLFQGVVKRPDFLVLVEAIGLIAVDAKYRRRYRNTFTLPLEKEVRRAIMFERIFRMPMWYAFRGPDANTWFWISALKAFEVGRPKKEHDFLDIDVKEFVVLRSAEDFAKLYTQRLPRLKRLNAMPNT